MSRFQILFRTTIVLLMGVVVIAEAKAQGPALQSSAVQPSAVQPSAVQPSAVQPSVMQRPATLPATQPRGGQTDYVSNQIEGPVETSAAGRGNFPELIVPQENDHDQEQAETGLAGPVVTTVSSLLVVLAVFGVLVWVSRRYGGKGNVSGGLPEDVLRKLGSSTIDGKTRVSFLRVGSRILVVGQSASGDPQTLTEITDFEEVEQITNRCLGRPEIVGRREVHPESIHSSAVRPVRRDMAAG